MISNNKHLTYGDLKEFLILRKQKSSSSLDRDYIKKHIDFCSVCWSVWNKVRWDLADGSRGYIELKEFLGDSFYKYFDSSWALAADWHEKKRVTASEIAEFYIKTPYYVYNSLIHHESGDRDDISDEIKRLVNDFKISSAIDYGCGIGTDGLFFLDSGVFVHFIDYENLSTHFLKWRLEKRKHKEYLIHNVKNLKTFPEAEMFWTYDVLEHIKYPEKIIEKINPKTRLLIHESNNDDDAGGRHPFHFSFDHENFENKLKKAGFKKITDLGYSSLQVFHRS